MNKKLLLLCGMILATFAPFGIAEAQEESINTTDFGVEVGLGSDYFFRGVSQMGDGAHWNIGAKGEWNGFYGGAWIGNVDFGDEASYEYDLFAGYNMQVTDMFSVDLGVIQYRYDEGYDMVEEVYAGMSYDMFSARVYQNTDTNDTYAEAMLDVSRFIPVFDLSLHYGYADSDDDFSALNLGYSVTDKLDAYVTIMLETVMDGQTMDSVSAGFNYRF